MSCSFTLAELAKAVDGVVRGDAARRIVGVNSVEAAGAEEIAWAADPRHGAKLTASRAGAVVVRTGFGATPMPAILVDDPALAILEILKRFAPPAAHPEVGVHPTAVVSPSATLGRDVAIGPHAVIGEHAAVGDRTVCHAHVAIGPESALGSDCVLWPGVIVRERCRVGSHVVCHPNVSIGGDGFGYHFAEGRHTKIPQIGTVVVEDHVEIGAGSCIDRAKFGETRIGEGTKIDNLVQIGHNVQVGPHCVIVAQAGIAGSAKLGAYVVLGGKVGVRDHVVIAERVRAAACCCISKDVPAGMVVNGIPAIDNRQYLREQALVRRLAEYVSQIKDLTRRVEQLEAAADH